MSVKWKYKIDLRSDKVLKSIEKEIGTNLPKEFVEFITENNAASPDKNCVIINGVERVFEAVLSFNEKESDAFTYSAARKAISTKGIIPFAVDPFGNCFCYSVDNKTIVFYLHEEKSIVESKLSLAKLVKELH